MRQTASRQAQVQGTQEFVGAIVFLLAVALIVAASV